LTKPETNRIIVTTENPHSADCLSLLAELTNELAQLYGDDGGANSFSLDDALAPGAAFLVARLEGTAIGCGAIRQFAPNTAEIKRLYVVPDARGKGVGRRILRELESAALELGYNRVRLETGLKQPEAIGLYESEGYRRVECYGKHIGNLMSVCFEKPLVGARANCIEQE
jgi:GNAT superfamily N-acetyltransferase